MTEKQLQRLQAKIDGLKGQGSVKPADIESIAQSLFRTLNNRGKHPTWISPLPTRPPIAIPNHSKELNRFTARQILNELEQDILEFQKEITPYETDAHDDQTDDK